MDGSRRIVGVALIAGSLLVAACTPVAGGGPTTTTGATATTAATTTTARTTTTTASTTTAPANPVDFCTAAAAAATDQILVKPTGAGSARAAVFRALGATRSVAVGNGWWSVTLDDAARIDALRAKAAKLGGVAALEPNEEVRLDATTLPALTDPLAAQQWALEQSNDVDVDVQRAWSVARGSASTVVAVVDTGIALNHSDLKNNVWVNSKEIAGNGIDDDRNGVVDDVRGARFANGGVPSGDPTEVAGTGSFVGHGTHLAGIIAATADNGLGIAGIAPGVRVMPVKVYDANGVTTIADIVAALDYAVKNGAKVINASFSGTSCNEALYDAFRAADNAGVVTAAAAGNDGATAKSYPAAYPLANLISVGAIDSTGAIASYSNRGSWVQVFAPGESILSTFPDNTYVTWGGTSMAAPHVAAIAALVRSQNPTWTAYQVKSRVLATVDADLRYRGNSSTGGRVNAGNAVGAP